MICLFNHNNLGAGDTMPKILLFSILAFFVYAVPARADLCILPGGRNVSECYEHGPQVCGTFEDGRPLYCSGNFYGSGSSGSKMSTTEWVMLSVGVGLVVVATAAYFFHKKPSKNNPGQISLMTF